MNQNYLAIAQFLLLLLFFESLTTVREGTQLTYLCHTFAHIQYDFVPKYDYFFSLQIKHGFTVENVYINFTINFQPYISMISCLKHNYFYCWKSK